MQETYRFRRGFCEFFKLLKSLKMVYTLKDWRKQKEIDRKKFLDLLIFLT
jgi:hypothetical protein